MPERAGQWAEAGSAFVEHWMGLLRSPLDLEEEKVSFTGDDSSLCYILR